MLVMAKSSTSDEVKRAEGARLKAIFLRRKSEWGITQESLCASIGLNQGLLYSFFVGKRPIPVETLLDLAIELDFEPTEVRPDMAGLLNKMLDAMRRQSADDLLEGLSDEARQEAINYIRYMKEKDAQ